MITTIFKLDYRYFVVSLFLLIATSSISQTINVSPNQIKQKVTFGGDAKLTIKEWAEGTTNAVSQKLYGDMNLKILRVPIFALQPISDPIYDNVITVINSVKAKNPNVKIFASIANGDGYGTDHHGAAKFPSSWIGCCESNVYKLSLVTYAAYLDKFMTRMKNAGITIDYLGPWNEDNATQSDHYKVFNQMTKLGSTKKVGIERWGLKTSVNDIDPIDNEVDITGSHFYDDDKIDSSLWDSTWSSLVKASANPVWYTEATRYSTNDNISNLVAGMANIIPAMRAGADAIIFYQACDRFVKSNGIPLPIKYTGFQNLVNNSSGNVVTSTTNDNNIRVISFRNNLVLDIHIVNTGTVQKKVAVNLTNGFTATGDVKRKIWTSLDTGEINTYKLDKKTTWDVTVGANSYVHLKVPLKTVVNQKIAGEMKTLIEEDNSKDLSSEFKITYYPSKSSFQVNLPKIEAVKEVKIKIFSLDGKELFSEKKAFSETILVNSGLSSGIYIALVEAGNEVFKSKLFIKD